jgi:hypothetical protein
MRRRTRRGGTLPPEIKAVRKRFEDWRKTKEGRERIPDRLWASAIRLCKDHNVHRVSTWLRLNHSALRDRVEAAAARRVPRKKSQPAFVELVAQGQSTPAEYTLELENADGAKIRIELRGAGVGDLAVLARSLWRKDA